MFGFHLNFVYHFLQAFLPVVRRLSLKEHQGISLLKQANIPVAPFGVSRNADDLYKEAQKIGKHIYSRVKSSCAVSYGPLNKIPKAIPLFGMILL